MNKYEKYDEQIIKLAKEGNKPYQISRELKIDARRVIDRLKINNIQYKKGNTNERIEIQDEIQEQVLIGTIIGDGCIFKGKGNVNFRMNLAHSFKQKQYFMYKYNILKNLKFKKPKIEKEVHIKTNKEYTCIKTQSLTNPLFTELYGIWYKDGKKVIPKSQLNKIKDLAIAIVFFDDGSKTESSYQISMSNYDIESINNFRILLFEKYGIETNLHKNKNVYIKAISKDKFKNMIKKYATSDVLYKLGELLETP